MSCVEYESVDIEKIQSRGVSRKSGLVALLGHRARPGRQATGRIDEVLTKVLDLQMAQGSMPA
jgi:hypothetical protein